MTLKLLTIRKRIKIEPESDTLSSSDKKLHSSLSKLYKIQNFVDHLNHYGIQNIVFVFQLVTCLFTTFLHACKNVHAHFLTWKWSFTNSIFCCRTVVLSPSQRRLHSVLSEENPNYILIVWSFKSQHERNSHLLSNFFICTYTFHVDLIHFHNEKY